MDNLKQRLREKIVNNEYCKFDLLLKLYPVDYLLTEKPVILREEIALTLNIKVEDINPKAFNQWRRRLKLKSPISLKIAPERNSISPSTPIVDDIFNPVRKKENIEDYIKPVRSQNK